MQAERPAPEPTPQTSAFWEACRQGTLLLEFCPTCQAYQFYPRGFCSRCGGESVEWRPSGGRGTVYAWTVTWRAPSPAWEVPYVVAVIQLDEGPRLYANVIGEDAVDVAVGDPVVLTWEKRGATISLPQFRRVRTSKLGDEGTSLSGDRGGD